MENHQDGIILAGAVEVSPESLPVAEPPSVPVVGIDFPLVLDLEEPVESPPPPAESPSPAMSDDEDVFMNIYDRAEVLLIKDWMERTRITRREVEYLFVSALISERLKTFLRVLYGPQWEAKFLRGGETLLAQLGACVSGYSGLTGFQREQWDRQFPVWTAVGLRAQLKNSLSPAASSRWSRPPSGPREPLTSRRPFLL